jgi:ribonuclease G
MHIEILIDSYRGGIRAAVIEDGKLAELYLDKGCSEQCVGDIYKGIVDAVLPGIQSAFIDIGYERKGFLHIDDIVSTGLDDISMDFGEEDVNTRAINKHSEIQDILRPGQELLVQVQKESLGEKGAKLTTNISLPGRLAVLMPFQNRTFVSTRISDTEARNRLIALLDDLKPKKTGVIARTTAGTADAREIENDLSQLLLTWERILNRAERDRGPSLIFKEKDLLERVLRDVFTEDVNVLIVDSMEVYERAQTIIDVISPALAHRIRFYEDNTPIFDAFGVENEIERIFRRKIWLRSGGYIVIEETEALTAIDVNTGRFLGREDMEATILKTNLEAATEIARQVRLRNTGGIIIIDFIDMANVENKEALMVSFNGSLRRDRSRIKVLELSELGLVEMTRQRTRESVTAILSRHCPSCGGRGYVLTLEAMADKVEREITRVFQTRSDRDILVAVNPQVKEFLNEYYRRRLENLETKHNGSISLEARQDMSLDGFEILNIKGINYSD